jgi:RHS repeat-associated protein
VTYTYDLNGNQTGASSGRAYGYNVFDQAISLTGPAGGTAQAASYLGPNQSEMVTGAGEQYVNNVLGVGAKVYSDATVSYFTRDENGALLGERAPAGAKYYFIPDGLGSTMATTGSTGAVANSYKYDPYGAIVTASETSAKPTSFRFAGGVYSPAVALHKFGERWYDQSLDRWTQEDPLDQTGDLQQGNRYLYAGNNPTNRTDPTGRSTICDEQGCKSTCGWHECTGDVEDHYRIWQAFDDACYGFGAISFVARRTNPWVAGGCIVYGGIRRATQ